MNIVQLPSQRHRHHSKSPDMPGCSVKISPIPRSKGQLMALVMSRFTKTMSHYVIMSLDHGYHGIWMVAQATTLFDVAVQFCGRRQTLSFVIRLLSIAIETGAMLQGLQGFLHFGQRSTSMCCDFNVMFFLLCY